MIAKKIFLPILNKIQKKKEIKKVIQGIEYFKNGEIQKAIDCYNYLIDKINLDE